MRGLCFAQADPAHVTARITDGENGNRMSAAVCTLFAAGSRIRGRLGVSAEIVVRMLLLKHIRNWSFDVVEREL
jgi:hypothetical protein